MPKLIGEYCFKNPHTTSPADVEPNDAFAMKLVVVAGLANDWAAYIGPTDWPDERVAREGRKLTAQEAPTLYVMYGRSYRD